MQMLAVGEAVASVTDGSGIATITTPFGPRRTVVCQILPDNSWNGSLKLQVSDDNSTWSDATGAAITGATGLPILENVELKRYVRYSCTAFTAGTCSVYLLGGL